MIGIREQQGISRKELAEKLNIPYTTLRNYETNQREPGHRLLVEIAQVLSISVDTLIGNDKYDKHEVTENENKLIKKYRKLDAHGKELVDMLLDKEYERCDNVIKLQEKEDLKKYAGVTAARGGGVRVDDEEEMRFNKMAFENLIGSKKDNKRGKGD